MKSQVEKWISRANKDLSVAEIVHDHSLENDEDVAFHCQQAIEKYFKAFLIENDLPLVRTHDLTQLYGMIKKITDLHIDEEKLFSISNVYIDSRYPDVGHMVIPSREQAHEFIAFAKEVKTIISSAMT